MELQNQKPVSFETQLSQAELEDPKHLEKYGTSPQEAAKRLLDLGYTPEDWDRIIETQAPMSHTIRGLIIIARGQTKRLEWVINQNLRHQEGDPNVRWDETLLPPSNPKP